MRRLANLGYALLFGATAFATPSPGQVPIAETRDDELVPVRLVHVDQNDGDAGNRLAELLRGHVEQSDELRFEERSTLVVWLRTLTLPPISVVDDPAGRSPGVAWAIIIDLAGQHVTDNIGFADSERLEAAADGIAASLTEMARELAREKTVALNE